MPELTHADLANLEREFFAESRFKSQRFGQFFCNKFGVKDPDIFHEKDFHTAETLIYQRFVKCET